MIKVKHIGRKPGKGNFNVPRSAYPEIYRLFIEGQTCAADIGKAYGITRIAGESPPGFSRGMNPYAPG